MSACYYFWNGREIIEVPLEAKLSRVDLARLYKDLPCLRPHRLPHPGHSYGKVNFAGWRHIPKAKIPKPLRMLALVLGVS